jgi:hypothetical protein
MLFKKIKTINAGKRNPDTKKIPFIKNTQALKKRIFSANKSNMARSAPAQRK